MKYIVRMKTERGETESTWNDLGMARKQAARLLRVMRKSGVVMRACSRPLCYFELEHFLTGVEIEVLREHADGRRENFKEEREGDEPDYDLAAKYPSGWEDEANF